ncbi:adenylyltransferase and sulfurtransferase MOCS3 [Galendromus occidentalis]|uniref:Adenylyltransferase and sulfurtransferase MOCS3 homolog n=1 Tax=Galendromus occidentalis TaxID=34638 RepID=A0AAJ7L636_9ACAR|nr:adenylyltransferase and sulfurtransferase MOCS3 [Galendromus occidentalis]
MNRLKASQYLPDESIERYSRQILLPEIGVNGMHKLSAASVLIVGAGGLGCPVAMYLATSGVGTIGIVEYDVVELSNLHRQIGHREASVGFSKAKSLVSTLKTLNSSINYMSFETALSDSNAKGIVKDFDVVVDATDNVSSRYLLNDVCVLLRKPLVSGSALRWEGQLTVYNHKTGPCYRCVFPKPPPPETVTNCSDGGVLGPVTGVIGSMQALEVIKILLDEDGVLYGRLVMFDGLSGSHRTFRLRDRDPQCAVCGDEPTVSELIDYDAFCGSSACDKIPSLKILAPQDRYSPEEFKERLLNDPYVHIIDVRPSEEFAVCHIPDSLNLPFEELKASPSSLYEGLQDVIVVCRRGNESQLAVKMLKDLGVTAKDVVGGLQAWSRLPGVSFPSY